MQHRELEILESALEDIRGAPADTGTVELIVRRPEVEAREVLDAADLDEAEGLVGDCWRTRGSKSMEDGSANPDCQITLMNARSAAAIAGPRERWPLAGDQLYVDFDLSGANLPPGTRLQLGDAVLEVSAEPHLGCGKFAKRFGVDALKFVNSAAGRELNLRGINTRVVRGGEVRTGAAISKTAS
jgi:hypothetical protein